MADHFEQMRREKENLLAEWIRVPQTEKAKIMIRIMDIEEQLEAREQEENEARKIG